MCLTLVPTHPTAGHYGGGGDSGGGEGHSDLFGSCRDGPLTQCTHCRIMLKVSYSERSLWACSRGDFATL